MSFFRFVSSLFSFILSHIIPQKLPLFVFHQLHSSVYTLTVNALFFHHQFLIYFLFFFCHQQMPYLNPARSLGPSFVLNKWENHWVFWMGPLAGGAISGILFEIIFNSKKRRLHGKDSEESSSMNSDEDINYDMDLEKANPIQPKFHGGNYNTYRSASGNGQKQIVQQNMCQTMYQSKVEREPIYGGTRSLYCRSPPLTRANLHRSQSVYTKSNTAINRESSGVIRAGPLVPAQSLYPLRVAPSSQQNTHLQNQNVQNQMQQRTDSIYGIRGSLRQSTNTDRMSERIAERDREPQTAFQPIYGQRNNPTPNDTLTYESREEPVKYGRRPDSVYGMSNRRIQSAQSDDSSYGSYHGSSLTPPTRGSSQTGNFHPNGSIMSQQQTYGMLPLPNPPTQNQQSHHQQQQQQQQQQQPNQNERKLSTSTNSSQRTVEFKEFSSHKSAPGNGHVNQNPLPPPPPPQHHSQNFQMHSHPIRQN
jgi:Major intrinsic protein